jgi:site-specific recombinase XerC
LSIHSRFESPRALYYNGSFKWILLIIRYKGKSGRKSNNREQDIWSLYLYALKSPVTRERYQKRLEKFFDFLGLEDTTVEDKSKSFIRRIGQEDTQWVFNNLIKFMQFHLDRVNRKEITGATVRNYLKSIKLFCEMADIPVTWKKITRGLPRGKNYADDRIPTIEEIQKLLEYPDRRIKAIVYTMTSSGIRLCAWNYLKWGHIRPIEKGEEIVAAKIIVYSQEDEEYFTFISKEAHYSLKEWMKYREDARELIDENSWLMRDLWDTRVAQGRGFVTKPKKLASSGIKRLIERTIWAQGLRKKLENGKKRHPFQAIHSFRKWFKTRCEIAGMKPINIEKLLSHSIGISNSYYRPTDTELLEDYLKVSDLLMIDKQGKLQTELHKYEQKNQEENYIIKGKLQEREEEIKSLKCKYESDTNLFQEKMENRIQELFQKVDMKKLK